METDTKQRAPNAPPEPKTEPVEPRGERLRRHSHRTGLYTSAFGTVALGWLLGIVTSVSFYRRTRRRRAPAGTTASPT